MKCASTTPYKFPQSQSSLVELPYLASNQTLRLNEKHVCLIQHRRMQLSDAVNLQTQSVSLCLALHVIWFIVVSYFILVPIITWGFYLLYTLTRFSIIHKIHICQQEINSPKAKFWYYVVSFFNTALSLSRRVWDDSIYIRHG